MKVNERGVWMFPGGHRHDLLVSEGLRQVLTELSAATVIDIGCGDGSYTRHLASCGFDCIGYDGNPGTVQYAGELCGVADFSEPQDLGRFDAVLSLEVGEHIPQEYEDVYLDNLANHTAGTIIMSWAVPGQGGYSHVNERDNEYIIGKMGERGFVYDPHYSDYLRGMASTCFWFAKTIMVFTDGAHDNR